MAELGRVVEIWKDTGSLRVERVRLADSREAVRKSFSVRDLIAFTSEVDTLRRVESQFLTALIDAGVLVDGRAFLLREYVPGCTLRDALGSLERERREQVAVAVLCGLMALHKAGVCHLDLKPENVLLPQDGPVAAKLTDFSLSGVVAGESPGVRAAAGSVYYVSPERLLERPLSVRADLFAFGVMLFELFGGKLPSDPSAFYARFPQRPFLDCVDKGSLDPRLTPLVRRLTAVDPEQRPDSAARVLGLLAELGFTGPGMEGEAPLAPSLPGNLALREIVQQIETVLSEEPVVVCVELGRDDDPADLVREVSWTAAVRGRPFVAAKNEAAFGAVLDHSVVVAPLNRSLLEHIASTESRSGRGRCIVLYARPQDRDLMEVLCCKKLGPPRISEELLAQELFTSADLSMLSRAQRQLLQRLLEKGYGDSRTIERLLRALAERGAISLEHGRIVLGRLEIDWNELGKEISSPEPRPVLEPRLMQVLSFLQCTQSPVPMVVALSICEHCGISPRIAQIKLEQASCIELLFEAWKVLRSTGPLPGDDELANRHRLLSTWFRERARDPGRAFVHSMQATDTRAAAELLLEHGDTIAAAGADLVALPAERLAERLLTEDPSGGSALAAAARLLLRAGQSSVARGVLEQALQSRRIRGEARNALLLLLARIHLQGSRLDLARQTFEIGLRRTRGTKQELDFVQGLVEVLARSGEARSALPLIEAIERRSQDLKGRQKLEWTLIQITALLKARSVDAAADVVRRGINLARSAGEKSFLAMLLTHWAEIQRRQGQPRSAVDTAREALALREKAGQMHEAAALHSNLGVYLKECMRFAEAGHHFTTALELRRALGDARGLSVALANLGILALDQGLLADARRHFEQAQPWVEKHAESRVRAIFDLHMLRLAFSAGERRRFTRSLLELIDRCRREEEGDVEIEASLLLIERLLAAEHWEKADEWLRRVEARNQELRDGRLSSRLDLMKVVFRRMLSDRSTAGRLLNKIRTELHGTLLEVDAAFESMVVDDEFPTADALESIEKAARACGGRRQWLEACIWRLLWSVRRGDQHGQSATRRSIQEILDAIEPSASRVRRLRILVSMNALRRRALRRHGRSPAETEEEEELAANRDLLRTFLAINKRLSLETDLKRLLQYIVETALSLASGQRAFIVLQKGESTEFEASFTLSGGMISDPEREMSFSFLKEALKSGRPLVTTNAGLDPRFRERESVTELDLRSILCVPFRVDEETQGALYLDNPIREGVFGEREIELIDALADQAAIALRNLRSRNRIDELNRRLSRKVEVQTSDLLMARRTLERAGAEADTSAWIGESPAFQQVNRLIERLAATELSVLITGESGTGKELAARRLHELSSRQERPWVAENCSAIPETLLEAEFFGVRKGAFTGADRDRQGLFEIASGGTFLLDEVGDLPLALQAKLLRVLQERAIRPLGGDQPIAIDVRIVCASNRDLKKMVAEGRFREDLFYRLAAAEIHMPPLRERGDDSVRIARHFLEQLNREFDRTLRFHPDSEGRIKEFSWPGNIRQLRNEVQRGFALADGDLLEWRADVSEPAPTGLKLDQPMTLLDLEKEAIRQALKRCRGSKEEAARSLGISRASIYDKVRRYGLSPDSGSTV